MEQMNTRVLLARRPADRMVAEDFEIDQQAVPAIQAGQFLIKNLYLSMDAGFRQWMNDGSDDNYLASMPLGEPVQSIIMGTVIESHNTEYPVGSIVVGRTFWEEYSVADGSDLMSIIEPDPELELYEYLCSLGPSGITAYFGLMDIGKPTAGDVFLINAAAGGVGALAGQMAKAEGCTTIGIAGGKKKCDWLYNSLNYDAVIDYKSAVSLDQQIKAAAPNGVNIVHDNVGGAMLGTMLGNLAENARIILCGAVSQYEKADGHDGVENMWELITKRARAEGFMFSDYVDRYPEALDYIGAMLKAKTLISPVYMTEGIEATGQTFIDMLDGTSSGKCLVSLIK